MSRPGRRCGLAGLVLSLTVFSLSQAWATTPAAIKRGHALAKEACAKCHAIEGPGPSPLKDVPVFSRLLQDFPGRNLDELLAEGLMAPHRPMPMFLANPEDVDNLLAYLLSIQAPAPPIDRPRP